MSSRDYIRCQRKICSGLIAKPGRQVMVAHKSSWNKDNFLRDAEVMAVASAKLAASQISNMGKLLVGLFVFVALRRHFR